MMTEDLLPIAQNIVAANNLQPVQKANAPLIAALLAAKERRMPA